MSAAVDAKLPAQVIMNTDGASRGNPGPASAGVVISDSEGKVLREIGRYLGTQTNNYAEYSALLIGLEECLSGGAKEILVRADSELMIKQMKGIYKVKSESIRELYEGCRRLVTAFQRVRFEHVFREKNKEADALANKALDQRRG